MIQYFAITSVCIVPNFAGNTVSFKSQSFSSVILLLRSVVGLGKVNFIPKSFLYPIKKHVFYLAEHRNQETFNN
jgi:hypothetical protein